ncbi:MAG: hypothetical protein IJV14_14800 [Lachnospiraceae bacterium]|nr:hypothetical protein [Lachnospiraceae bacterium]
MTEESQLEEKNVVLYDDGQFKVTYLGIIDYKDMYPGEQDIGTGYIQMLVENNSNQDTTVVLTDLYVNGMSAFPMVGMPMDIAPGKRSKNPFIYSYNQLDISERSQVESIEFIMHFWDGLHLSEILGFLSPLII